jgi:hypothetical protein
MPNIIILCNDKRCNVQSNNGSYIKSLSKQQYQIKGLHMRNAEQYALLRLAKKRQNCFN